MKPMASGYLSAEFDNSASKSRTRHANFPGIRRHNRAARENGKEEKDEKFMQVPNRTMLPRRPKAVSDVIRCFLGQLLTAKDAAHNAHLG